MATERLLIKVVADTRDAVQKVDALGKTSTTRLGAAGKSAEGFSASMDKVGSRLITAGAAATTAGVAMTAGLYSAAMSAQDLADSVDKAQATFGDKGAKSLDSFAEGAADALGKSKAAALDAASAYGLLLKQQGIGGAALARQSADLATRTADLAERYKKPYEEVQKAIEGVLRTGTAKSLKGLLGIDIQIDPSSLKGLDTAERTAKVLDEVFRQTAESAGFFAKSTDDVGVKIAQTQAKWENAKASFGEASLPALTTLADSVTGLLDTFNNLPAGVKNAASTLAAFGAAAAVIGGPLTSLAGVGAKAFAPLVTEGSKLGGVISGLGVTGAGASAALGPLAAVAVGAGVAFEAWASESAQVDKQVQSLTASVLALTDASDTLPTLASSLQSILSVNNGAQDVFAKTGISVAEVTKAVNAAPGGFDKFRDNVDGLTGSLESLGGLVTFDDDLKGIQEQADLAGPSIGKIVARLLDLYKAGTLSADEVRKAVDYFTDLDKGAKSSAQALAGQAQALRDYAGVAAATADYRVAADPTVGLDRQVEALERLKVQFPEAARAVGLMDPALDKNTASADSAGKAIESFADRVERAATKITEAGKDLTLPNLASDITNPAKVALSYEQASLRYEQAQKRLNGVGKTTKNDDRVKSALERIADAQDGVTDSLNRRRKAQERLDDLTKKSAVAGSVPLIQEISKAADQGVADAKKRLDEVIAQFGEGSTQATAARSAVTSATERRDRSTGLLGQALQEQGGINQREIRDAKQGVADADRDIAKAVRDKSEAESKYSETLKDGTDSTLDKKAALLDFWQASIDKYEAAASLGQAAQDGLDPYGALRDIVGQTGENAGIATDKLSAMATTIGEMSTESAKALGLIAPLISKLQQETDKASMSPAQREGIPSYQTRPSRFSPLPSNTPSSILGPGQYRIPFAEGGVVSGVGIQDSVPAILTPGEFVLTRSAASRYGTEALKALNRGTATVQKFATGGSVRGPVSVPVSSFAATQTPARSSRSVEVSPTINITSTEPKKAADETIRSLRRATFLAGVR